MAQLEIFLASEDHAALDRSVRKLVSALPAGESADVTVSLRPREASAQVRLVTILEPSEKIAPALAHLDLPKNITIRTR